MSVIKNHKLFQYRNDSELVLDWRISNCFAKPPQAPPRACNCTVQLSVNRCLQLQLSELSTIVTSIKRLVLWLFCGTIENILLTMASASSSSARSLFADSKMRLADRVQVNVNNIASLARQVVRGSKSNEVSTFVAKHARFGNCRNGFRFWCIPPGISPCKKTLLKTVRATWKNYSYYPSIWGTSTIRCWDRRNNWKKSKNKSGQCRGERKRQTRTVVYGEMFTCGRKTSATMPCYWTGLNKDTTLYSRFKYHGLVKISAVNDLLLAYQWLVQKLYSIQ